MEDQSMSHEAQRSCEELNKITGLSEQIYAAASTLDKPERHMISDLAKLIQWVAYDAANPGSVEAAHAIANLKGAVSR
jgi:hypothetical protein